MDRRGHPRKHAQSVNVRAHETAAVNAVAADVAPEAGMTIDVTEEPFLLTAQGCRL
jgi:hypothetical protein